MTIDKLTIKFMGKKETVFRVLDKDGEVLRCFETETEAQEWINSK